MKLSCTRENLHQGLSITSHLSNKNVNLPVLQNVLVKAEGGTIRFTTTNLEMAISCSVRGKVEEGGEHTIPSKLFFDYVSLLPNETVEMVVLEGCLNIACGKQKTKINGLPAAEFPVVPSIEVVREYQVPVEGLRKALSRVLFAVATNESRPELAGVSVRFSGKSLTLAATDSYRLAEAKVQLAAEAPEAQVIIPSKTLAEINRILSVFKDEVESANEAVLRFSDNQLVFQYGSVELVSRLIEGNYPDYTQIIPSEFQTKAILDREDFIKAVKTASLFSKTGLFDITLSLDEGEKQLKITATDANRGENTAICDADVSGQKNAVTVNYRYLLDGLNAMQAEKVVFEMIDASNPCLVTPQGDEQKEYLYIVMPIKQ